MPEHQHLNSVKIKPEYKDLSYEVIKSICGTAYSHSRVSLPLMSRIDMRYYFMIHDIKVGDTVRVMRRNNYHEDHMCQWGRGDSMDDTIGKTYKITGIDGYTATLENHFRYLITVLKKEK